MKKKIADIWVNALRSDEFKQGRGKLCKIQKGKKEFCCLGVLCELYQRDRTKNKKKKLLSNVDWTGKYVEYDGMQNVLPDDVWKWAGMSTPNGQFTNMNGTMLTSMNDDGWSFKEIADEIEKDYQGL